VWGPSVPKYSATALAIWGNENKLAGPAYSGFHVIRTLSSTLIKVEIVCSATAVSSAETGYSDPSQHCTVADEPFLELQWSHALWILSQFINSMTECTDAFLRYLKAMKLNASLVNDVFQSLRRMQLCHHYSGSLHWIHETWRTTDRCPISALS